jgi:hypothetical protein
MWMMVDLTFFDLVADRIDEYAAAHRAVRADVPRLGGAGLIATACCNISVCYTRIMALLNMHTSYRCPPAMNRPESDPANTTTVALFCRQSAYPHVNERVSFLT